MTKTPKTKTPKTRTMRRTSLVIAAGIVWGVCVPALAQEQAPTPEPGQNPAPVQSQVQPQVPPQDQLQVQPPVATSAPPAPEAIAKAPAAPVRYTFNRVDDGFLRLDGVSGQVAICSQHAVGWACQAVPEDRAALESEIARLQVAVAGLKTEIAALRAPPPPPRPPAELTPSAENKDDAKIAEPKIKLPSHEDIERARAVVEKVWWRLVDMIVGFKNDLMKKG